MRVTEDLEKLIVQDLVAGKTQDDIALERGVSQSTVSRINRRANYSPKYRPADVREIRRLVNAGLRHAFDEAKTEVTQGYIRELTERLHALVDYTDYLETDQLEMLWELPPGLFANAMAFLRFEARMRPYRYDVPDGTDATKARGTVRDGTHGFTEDVS